MKTAETNTLEYTFDWGECGGQRTYMICDDFLRKNFSDVRKSNKISITISDFDDGGVPVVFRFSKNRHSIWRTHDCRYSPNVHKMKNPKFRPGGSMYGGMIEFIRKNFGMFFENRVFYVNVWIHPEESE